MAQSEPYSQAATSGALFAAFQDAFRCHPAGVAIVTADPGDGPVALTVSSLISVSAEPPLVAFSLSARSSSSPRVLAAGSIVIHLPRYADLHLAQLGATKGADRFGDGIEWERLPTGEPRYTGIGTWFRAQLRGTLTLDGATLVAAELLEGAVTEAGDAPEQDTLVYLDRRWHRLRDPADPTA